MRSVEGAKLRLTLQYSDGSAGGSVQGDSGFDRQQETITWHALDALELEGIATNIGRDDRLRAEPRLKAFH